MTALELTALREKLDEIDGRLVELLAVRFRVTNEVGKYKAKHALNPVDNVREAEQERRLARLAEEHGLNPEVATKVFRVVVAEVVANHAVLASQGTHPSEAGEGRISEA